ncbi:MAG: YqgE/AlgH family protein [Actinomycetota bacterium]|nr:YqgE/AlgH family protein [Actinomycetota bacterium]
MAVTSYRGQLLLATPRLVEPTFARAVLLMLEHSEDGALAVVLNRPTELTVLEALPSWSDLAAEPARVFAGGPVSPEAAVCLGRVDPAAIPDDGWARLSGELATVDLDTDPTGLVGTVAAVRLFSGYAGWAPQQLEAELAVGSWYVVDAEAGDVFSAEPEGLWRGVLRRQRGSLAMVATFPPDPSLN